MNAPSNDTIQQASSKVELSEVINGWKADGLRVGFVPTMGALHAGHLSLVNLALEHADRCVASVFVNPTQFAPHEDFDAYPRDIRDDLGKLQSAGVHLVYTPDEDEIYPDGTDTNIKAGEAGKGLDTDFRPHFFDGVVNVVARLFEQVQPDIAIFGEKDFQQLQIIRDMVKTHNIPVEIIGGEIIRDEHGLALASRNAYLSAEELEIARMLNQIIYKAAFDVKEGTPAKEATKDARANMITTGFDKVDYVEQRWNRILAAGWVGKTRLIDNVAI